MLTMNEAYSPVYIIQGWGKAVVSCRYHKMVNAMSLQNYNNTSYIIQRNLMNNQEFWQKA